MKFEIRELPEEYKYNGLHYKLIKRTKHVAMYDTGRSIEVFKIVVKKPNKYFDRPYEAFPTNRDWSNRTDCRAYSSSRKRELAEKWFSHLVDKAEKNNAVIKNIQAEPKQNKSSIRKAG